MATINNKTHTHALELQMLVGIDKYFKTATSVTLLGTSYTPAQLKAVFQAELDAAAATQATHAAWQVSVDKERTAHASAHAVQLGLKALVVMQYGKKAVDVLADFGFSPPKVTKAAPATKVQATAKSKATRKARGTLGSQQKKKVTGAAPSATAQSAPAPMAPVPKAT